MPDDFHYDISISHSAKDKAVVRPLAERPLADGVIRKGEGRRTKDEIQLLPSSLILHPFPRDPLNKERPFLARLQTNRYSFDEAQTAARKANAAGN